MRIISRHTISKPNFIRKILFPNEIMSMVYPSKCLFFGWVTGIFMLLSSVANAQCDIEVSGVLAYCNAVHGNGSFPGFFIGFRIKSIDGDTLNVVDLAGNVPMNLGKRINDINNEFEPSDTSRVRARIAGGADSLEYWYFGPFMDGDSFNIVLIDPDGICDTVEVASGTFTCEGQDPNACDEDVPLYSLDFSQSQWEIGGGGGVNENVDQVFLVMQRSRVATCCQTNNERCFEFIITLDDDDIGLLIDDVGNGSTGGHIYADSLNGFACGTTQQNTWPWFQDNGQSADEPLCLSGSAREWIVLSCKQGNNVTGVSIGTVGELNIYPEYVYEDCTVQLEVLNASSASWSSADDPNLDNLINFTLDSLSVTFSYDGDTFGPVTSCDGDTFTYFIAGYPDNTCLGADSILYDTTFVVVYPDFSIWIDSVCIGTDSILLNAILTSGALNCGYSFIWSTGDTTQSIIVPDSSAQYVIDVIREDLDSLVRDCSPATDVINVEQRAILCLPDMVFECISEPPQDSIELIGIAGCGVNPLITSFEMSNNGSGCLLDSLIITRYYVVDYDGDTINTLTDKDTCIQLFIYVDDEPPVISCPPNITIGCTAGTLPENTGGYATAIDNCEAPVVTYSDAITGGACPQEFIIIRTWTATDDCGLASTCNQRIAIEDNTPPAITCPANITIQCTDSTLPVNTGSASANDICDTLVTPTYTDVFPAGACPSTIRRTWRATDDCGNSSTCLQIITLTDTVAPLVTCPPDITVSCSSSTNPSNTGFATGTDNCDVSLNISHTNSVVTGSCPQNLIITRTWNVSDDCGNLTTCIQIITTIDTIPPNLNCPVDITIQCNTGTLPAQTGSGSATDNCDPIALVTYSDITIGGTCPQEHTIFRTWVATDDCGNSSTCIQTIQVRDTIPPVVTCPANITIDCTEGTLPGNTGFATASDNCDPTVDPAFTDNITNGECPQEYTITRTWVATDDCGNSNMCIQTILVRDTAPPVMTCPSNITIDCADNTLPGNTGFATASDNCDASVVPAYTDSITNGGCPQEYTIARTWVAIDDCGNFNTCIQTIQVRDTTPPDLTCPSNITIECTDNTLPVSTGLATASDNCDATVVPVYTDSITNGDCPQEYTIIRTWRATDDCGNFNACIQTIQVRDTTPPEVTCPSNITIDCADNTLPGNTGFATASDNCDASVVPAYTDSITNGGCPQEYTIARTWVATDDCGNFNTCIQIIQVRDTIPPDLTCPSNITIECTDDTLPVSTGLAIASDNCDASVVPVYTDSITNGDCPQEYTIMRTWEATDDCGNSNTCIQTIQVRDTTPPDLTCPANITIECTDDSLPVSTGFATASDNCDATVVPVYTDSITNGDCLQEYTIIRTWRATDDCGNFNACIQTIQVRDTTPPEVTCPSNITIDCADNTLPGNTGFATASDNCDASVVPAYTDSITNGGCPQEYTIARTWVATDDCGNFNTCIQIIQVRDTTPPDLTCPSSITIECTDNTLPVSTGLATASDNCDATVVPVYTDSITNGDCPQEYTIMRTWEATDDCGNFNTCIQTIQVRDTIPPDLTCPSNITIECTDDTLPVSTGLAIASDNCDATVVPVYTDSITNGDCPQEYTIVRTWGATDDCGNLNTCIQTIQVRDTTPPAVTCPSNITIDCTDDTLPGNTGFATASDNCDATVVPAFTDNITNGDCLQEYTITRTWVATDDCGNSSTCIQTIQVRDTIPPVVTCPSNITIDCTESTLPANTGYATASDNCDATVVPAYTDNITNGECPQEYSITRTWVATDDCGNASSCVQIINVVDQTAPVITCPADVTINYMDSSLPANTGSATAIDDCDTLAVISYTDALPSTCPVLNIVMRTWVATDDCGNSSSCIQEILIEDDGSICGTVEDDLGEFLDSVEIQLIVDVNSNGTYDGSDTILYSVFTDTAGNYCFTNVKPCGYILREIQPLTYGDLFDYDFTADPDGNDSIDGPDNEIPVILGQGEGDNDNNFIDIVCPTILPVIPSDTICDGGVVMFETVPMNPGPLNYTWDFGSGSSPGSAMGLGPHSVSYVTTTNNQMGGAIILLTISKPGCPDLTGQVSTVDINTYPDPSINGSTANLCYFMNRTFQPVAPEIPGATYNWSFGSNAVPLTATGYGPHTVYYTVAGPKVVSLVIHPNEAGAQCPDSSTLAFNVTNCPGNITGTVKSVSGVGIQGVNLRLYADEDQNGLADNNTIIRSVFTTVNGSYSMVGLVPASYVIIQTQPQSWTTVDDEDTSDDGDPVPNIDSLDNLIPATLTPSEIDANNTFIEIANPGSINGTVFIDADGDEIPDSGEGIQGVILNVYEDNNLDGMPDSGTPVDTAITSSSGNYSFTNMEIGNYVLEETPQAGYESVQDFDATNDQDSVANSNTQDDLIPVTLLNQENDDHNYFIDEYECSLIVSNTNDSGQGSLRFMTGCALDGDTIILDTSLGGQTILLTSSKIEIDQDIVIYSDCVPRITIASSVPGLFDIGLNKHVEFHGLDLVSGISGNAGAAFYNFGILKLVNINVFKNPLLTIGDILIRNTPGSELIIQGSCNLYED